MKAKRRSGFLTAVLAFLSVAVLLFGAVIPSFASDNTEAETVYVVGDTVAIPERTLTVDGENIKATVMVEEPSGTLLKVTDSFVIREGGLHKVIYKAVSSKGSLKQDSFEFLACSPLYQVHSSTSSISFGNYYYGDYMIDREAVLASIASTDKFTYSEIIDLRELNGESFLEFFVTPENIGTVDASKIEVVLTDVYDSDNFVTIAIKKGTAGQAGAAWAEKLSYITGNAPSQNPTGLEKNKGDLVIDETNYLLHDADVWGANISFALPGNPNYVSLDNPHNDPESVGSQTLALSMNIDDQSIYANGQLVTILSSELIYNNNVWDGFTTGECFLSISASNFNASALNIAITKIGPSSIDDEDVEGTEKLKNNLFKDTSAPVISLEDGDLYKEGYPFALVGTEYPVFLVSAQDDYTKNLSVNAKVYYGYGTNNQVEVDHSDGKFTPFKEGKYTIVYSALDLYGNEGTLNVEVEAMAVSHPSLEAEVPQLSNAVVGNYYSIPAPQIRNASGICGWKAEAIHKATGYVYSISSDESGFFPEYSGEYEVVYYVWDYIKSISETVSLTVQNNDTPIFFEDPVLPEYFIYGCEYRLPDILAKVYSSGQPVECTPEIYIVEDGGSEYAGSYRFISYASESVQIIYRVENKGKVTEFVSKTIPVIDVGYNGTYSVDKYFVKEYITSTSYGKYIRFTVDNDNEGTATLKFINPLQTFDYSLKFSSIGYGMNKVNIYLTDYADPSVQLKCSYRYSSGQVYFSLNDGAEILLENQKFDDSESPLNLAVTGNGLNVMPTGTSVLSISVSSDLSGKKFSGFTDSMAYMTVELEDITNYKQAGIDVYNLSGQPISGIYVDNIKPKISAIAQSGARPFGIQFTIPGVYIGDVLDPSLTVTMSVTAPDGSYVTAEDGTVLDEKNAKYYNDYTITFDQYGSYSVNYTVTDISGNKLPFTYVLTSSDMIDPEVKILDHQTEGKVGEGITIAEIEITDNNDKDLEAFIVYTFVTTPEGQSFAMVDKAGEATKVFSVKTAGVYTVSYMVKDSSGNMVVASYEINVK